MGILLSCILCRKGIYMGFIYVVKNTVNNKVYIGQTTQTIEIKPPQSH